MAKLTRPTSHLVKHKQYLLEEAFDDRIPFKYEPSPRGCMNEIASRRPNVVRVSTWNLQGWNVAWTLYGKDLASKKMVRDRQERILHAKVDFCGMQECLFGYEMPIETMAIYPLSNAYFGAADWGGDVALTGYKYGNSFVCRGELSGTTHKVYDDRQNLDGDAELRSYTRTTMDIEGVKVTIFNTHMSLIATRRKNMMHELFEAANAVEGRVVVMGDFNCDMASGEFKEFTDAGFLVVNNMDVNTRPSGSPWYIDNILYRGFRGLTYKGAQEHPTGLSDHLMLVAELEV